MKYPTSFILIIICGIIGLIFIANTPYSNSFSANSAVDRFLQHPYMSTLAAKKTDEINNTDVYILSAPRKSDFRPVIVDANSSTEKQMTSKVYRGIHILATGRSGSSFLGKILANSERVFYLYEPGRLVDLYRPSNEQAIAKNATQLHLYENIIKSLYHCRFENMEPYLNSMTQRVNYREQVCEIQVLLGHPCDSDKDPSDVSPNLNNTIDTKLTDLHEKCENKEFIVIKSIRMFDILNLAQLFNDSKMDFKILHLIRDPRGIILSKLKAWYPALNKKMKAEHRSVFDVQDLPSHWYSALDDWCKIWIKDASIGQQMLSKYMAIRYEDISMMPLMSTKEIYDKLGLGEVSENTVKWLNEHTMESRGEEYSLSRNSKLNAEKWRRNMTYMLAKRIQDLENCGKFLDTFGYIKVKRPQDLTNSTLSLIGKKQSLRT